MLFCLFSAVLSIDANARAALFGNEATSNWLLKPIGSPNDDFASYAHREDEMTYYLRVERGKMPNPSDESLWNYDVLILAYNVEDRQSFESIASLISWLREIKCPQPVILVETGNKQKSRIDAQDLDAAKSSPLVRVYVEIPPNQENHITDVFNQALRLYKETVSERQDVFLRIRGGNFLSWDLKGQNTVLSKMKTFVAMPGKLIVEGKNKANIVMELMEKTPKFREIVFSFAMKARGSYPRRWFFRSLQRRRDAFFGPFGTWAIRKAIRKAGKSSVAAQIIQADDPKRVELVFEAPQSIGIKSQTHEVPGGSAFQSGYEKDQGLMSVPSLDTRKIERGEGRRSFRQGISRGSFDGKQRQSISDRRIAPRLSTYRQQVIPTETQVQSDDSSTSQTERKEGFEKSGSIEGRFYPAKSLSEALPGLAAQVNEWQKIGNPGGGNCGFYSLLVASKVKTVMEQQNIPDVGGDKVCNEEIVVDRSEMRKLRIRVSEAMMNIWNGRNKEEFKEMYDNILMAVVFDDMLRGRYISNTTYEQYKDQFPIPEPMAYEAFVNLVNGYRQYGLLDGFMVGQVAEMMNRRIEVWQINRDGHSMQKYTFGEKLGAEEDQIRLVLFPGHWVAAVPPNFHGIVKYTGVPDEEVDG